MALKKNFTEGTKYYYAVIRSINWVKTMHVEITLELSKRDSSDEEYSELETMQHFAFEYSGGHDLYGSDLESNQNNFVKQAYLYVKEHIELFKDFEDF